MVRVAGTTCASTGFVSSEHVYYPAKLWHSSRDCPDGLPRWDRAVMFYARAAKKLCVSNFDAQRRFFSDVQGPKRREMILLILDTVIQRYAYSYSSVLIMRPGSGGLGLLLFVFGCVLISGSTWLRLVMWFNGQQYFISTCMTALPMRN